MGLITNADIHERFKGLRRMLHSIEKREQTAGIVASYKIAFLINRRFSEPRCEQMEEDLKNMPHGFSSERTHLALLKRSRQKMMDSRRLGGSFEHDFCSCGRQRNGSFQKLAYAELNLVSFILIVVYLSRE